MTHYLARRVWEHKQGAVPGFTKQYGVKQLVYYETYEVLAQAREREGNMKRWKRDWKVKRIEDVNPKWDDLYAKVNM